MRADPNAAVELDQALGREGEVRRLWAALATGDVLLRGRFGIGKTTLARLCVAAAPDGWSAHPIALAGCRTAAEAIAAVIAALIAAVELAPTSLEPDGGAALREAIAAALSRAPAGVVLILDDLDRWLAEVDDEGGSAALFDALAELRSTHPRLRVVLVTSTHLPRTLARRTSPALARLVDACASFELDPLSPESGARLVIALSLGGRVTAPDRAAFARSLAARCDHVPRWIHCAMAELVARGQPVDEGALERCLAAAVEQLDQPPWLLGRELAPVLDDYPQPQRSLALSILDQLALAEDRALSFAELRRQLAIETTIDADAITRVLAELRGDQLVVESGARIRFAGELLRAAWIRLRWATP